MYMYRLTPRSESIHIHILEKGTIYLISHDYDHANKPVFNEVLYNTRCDIIVCVFSMRTAQSLHNYLHIDHKIPPSSHSSRCTFLALLERNEQI